MGAGHWARLYARIACGLIAVFLFSGCALGDLFGRATPTPVPTRPPAPTFTPTPDFVEALIVVTPPNAGTPGVIVIPPGVDPRSVIPLPPTATPADTPTATVTTEPVVIVSPPSPTPAAESPLATPTPLPPGIVPIPTPTPLPGTPLEPTATPTLTWTPTVVPTPTPTSTPYVMVAAGLVSLRTGPGPDYPLVAQLGPNIPVSIVGQNPEGTWFQLCCVNGTSVWVAKTHVETYNDTAGVTLVLAGAAPTATPTATPTLTPTITPTPTATPYPFQVLEGPLYFPTSNELLTIWVKVVAPGGEPLPGYFLKVEFRNRTDGSTFEGRPNTKGEAPSSDRLEYNVPPGPASGNRVQFNYKFEFLPPDPKAEDPLSTLTRASVIDGYWRIYLMDGSGTQLSNAIEFNTLAGNTNREVYVAWVRTR
jgi:hypothetical protein